MRSKFVRRTMRSERCLVLTPVLPPLAAQFEFRSVPRSFVKTSVMMAGEFEFGSLFLGLEGHDESDTMNPDVHREKVTTGPGGPAPQARDPPPPTAPEAAPTQQARGPHPPPPQTRGPALQAWGPPPLPPRRPRPT